MSTDDKARAEDKPSLDYAEPRIIVQARAELQTCLIVMPSAADNLEEEEEDEVNKNKFFLPLHSFALTFTSCKLGCARQSPIKNLIKCLW